MRIAKHKVVSLDYRLADDDGGLIDSSDDGDPLLYIHGLGQLVTGLETALEGRRSGETLQVRVPPDSGYGQRDEDLVITAQRGQFERPEAIEVGMRVEIDGPGGAHLAIVADVQGEEVTLDANHPLAGLTLVFDVTVRAVRDATEEELRRGEVAED